MKTKPDLRKFTKTIQSAASELGPGFSYTTIKRRINANVWIKGIHWIDVGVGKNRQIRLNLDTIADRSTWRN